jgi:type 1 glutamine amidotransferase
MKPDVMRVVVLFVAVTASLASWGSSAQPAAGAGQADAKALAAKKAPPPTPAEINELSRKTPITSPEHVPLEEREKVDAAVPRQAPAAPKKLRKMLVMDFCTGYVHTSIPHANYAIELMGKYTRAYEPVFSNDLTNLKYENIRQYDAVFLNNTVGNIFADPEVRDGMLRFVREGGGILGLHGASYASQDWPEYGQMIGATTAPHRIEPGVIKIDDPDSPLTAMFGGNDFEYVEEYYRFLEDGPYSRAKLRILLSINVDRTDLIGEKPLYLRSDNDYGISWIKSYGNGRVFYTSLGHRESMFMTPVLAQHVLAGIQFVLGDLEADTTPSATLANTQTGKDE